MAYRIETKPSAQKAFERLPKEVQGRIAPKIDSLAENPRPHGSEKLAGGADLHRIRVGSYRVIYEIYDNVLLVLVVKIAPRGSVYRGL